MSVRTPVRRLMGAILAMLWLTAGAAAQAADPQPPPDPVAATDVAPLESAPPETVPPSEPTPSEPTPSEPTPSESTPSEPTPSDLAAAVVELEAAFPPRSTIALDLVSRTFDTGANRWEIVVDATLDSNAFCVPAVFDCIVAPQVQPAGASLVDVSCLSPHWNHLLVFTDHCIKQLGFAGANQRFRFTYRTDPGVTSGTVVLGAAFGRGVLPFIFNQLTQASLAVNLDVTLDVLKTCPETVEAGDTIACTVTVGYPDPGGGGPAITTATVTDIPPGGGQFQNGTLAFTAGAGTWSCVTLVCTLTAGTITAGSSVTLSYQADVAPLADGSVENEVELAYDDGGPVLASDLVEVTIFQPTDADLDIVETADTPTATPGQVVSWTVQVTNAGNPNGFPVDATGVTVSETPPPLVDGVTLSHVAGIGSWTCAAQQCTAATMPGGTATFRVTGTVAVGAPIGTTIVDDTQVEWVNDVFGPDFPLQASAAITVVAGPAPPTEGSDPAASGSLPLTGSPILTLVVAGLAATSVGLVLVSRRRPARR